MKGEKGIRILDPILGFRRNPQEEAEEDITRQDVPVWVGFLAAYFFDVSQTEGAKLPEHARVTGDKTSTATACAWLRQEMREHLGYRSDASGVAFWWGMIQ